MSDRNEMTLIASKGTLDWAYPPFILASTGIAMGKEVTVFCTFYGLKSLAKRLITPKNFSSRKPRYADEDALWTKMVSSN